MAYTVFEATLDLARALMDVFEGTATGGSLTTVVDSNNVKPAGWFSDGDGGTLWLKLTTVVTKRISGHTPAGTITFTPAQAGAVVAGNRYAAAPGIFPRYVLLQALESALREYGALEFVELVTATADKEEYTSSDNAIFANEIIDIEIADELTDPYEWIRHQRWEQIWQTGKLTLIFDDYTCPDEARQMKIHYLAEHPELTSDTQEINPQVNPERLIAMARVHAYRWQYERVKQDDPSISALLNEAKSTASQLTMAHPNRQSRQTRLAKW